MTPPEVDFRINPKLWPVIKRKGPAGAEHVWAIPWGGALGKVLLFRKDLFDARAFRIPPRNGHGTTCSRRRAS
jgi:hypothetical protein